MHASVKEGGGGGDSSTKYNINLGFIKPLSAVNGLQYKTINTHSKIGVTRGITE